MPNFIKLTQVALGLKIPIEVNVDLVIVLAGLESFKGSGILEGVDTAANTAVTLSGVSDIIYVSDYVSDIVEQINTKTRS